MVMPYQPGAMLRRPRCDDPQLHAREYLLNAMSKHGLAVWRVEYGVWQWEWHGQAGGADELSSAVVDALC